MSAFSTQFISLSCGLIKLQDLFELYRDDRRLPSAKSFNEELNQFFYADIQEITCRTESCKKISILKDSFVAPITSEILLARGWKNIEKVVKNDLLITDCGHNGVPWSIFETQETTYLSDKLTSFNIKLRGANNFVISSHYNGAGFIVRSHS